MTSKIRAESPQGWLFILSEQDGLDWVLSAEKMAFVRHHEPVAKRIRKDDTAFIYATKKLLRDTGKIIAAAEITGDVRFEKIQVGTGLYFWSWCPLRIHTRRDPADALPLKPLVPDLAFIRRKEHWSHYLRRGIVQLPSEDTELIQSSL